MASLTASLPGSRAFVSSIPDIYQLFSLYRYDLGADAVWTIAGICQSMLAYPLSNLPGEVARRARVRQRNIDYNAQLAQVCATYVQCRCTTATRSSAPPSSASDVRRPRDRTSDPSVSVAVRKLAARDLERRRRSSSV